MAWKTYKGSARGGSRTRKTGKIQLPPRQPKSVPGLKEKRYAAAQRRTPLMELPPIRNDDVLGSPNRGRMASPKMKAWTGGRSYGPTYTMTVQTRGKTPAVKRYR